MTVDKAMTKQLLPPPRDETERRRSPRLLKNDGISIKAVSNAAKTASTTKSGKKSKQSSPPLEEAAAAEPILKAHEIRYWKSGHRYVTGVDEAGRGPLAGPVVIAACTFESSNVQDEETLNAMINDSKMLTKEEREAAYAKIMANPHIHTSISVISHEVIDEINILQASLLGMTNCVLDLKRRGKCDVALFDGPFIPSQLIESNSTNKLQLEAVIKGDQKVRAIAAASIVAKVTRDRIMDEEDVKYPEYGFGKHAGYPVPAHRAALALHGPCAIHRRSFKPVIIAAAYKSKNTKTC